MRDLRIQIYQKKNIDWKKVPEDKHNDECYHLNSKKDNEESCGDAVDLGGWRTGGCTLIGDSLNRNVDVALNNVQALAYFLQNKQTQMRKFVKRFSSDIWLQIYLDNFL